MKKIMAAITMACLAMCYYNVDAAKKNKKKSDNTTQVDQENKTSISNSKKQKKKNKKKSSVLLDEVSDSEEDDGYDGDREFRSANKKRKNTPLLDQVSDSESETEYETAEEDFDDEIPADHKKKQKKVMKELKEKTDKRTYAEVVAGKKRKREDFDDKTKSKRVRTQEDFTPSAPPEEDEYSEDEPPSYEEATRDMKRLPSYEEATQDKEGLTSHDDEDDSDRKSYQSRTSDKKSKSNGKISNDEEENDVEEQDISEKDLKKRIKKIVGTPKDEDEEADAIAKVSKILNVPKAFLVIPQITYGAEGKKMGKIHLINPQNSQIPNRSLLVVFKEFEQKLKDILPVYVIPATLKDNEKTKAKKQAYYKKAGKIYDKKKKQAIDTYYTMPTKKEILENCAKYE